MVDFDANPDVLLVRKHLVEHLGPPDEVFEISGSPLPDSPVQSLNLAYFAPAGPHSPVVFATCGASLYRMKDDRRIEAIIILRREPEGPAFDAVHRLLASFALFAESNDQIVRPGDVVRAQEELQGFCSMDALLFMPPIPFVENFHALDVTEDERVELIWLLPVFESEATYALTHGPQALMMLFAAQGLDLTETDRDEANTLIEPQDAIEMAKKAAEENKKKLSEAGPQVTPPSAKPKTSRRNVGQGSFDVEETQTGAIKISRRKGAKKPKVKPKPPAQREPTPPPAEPASAPAAGRPARPARPAATKSGRQKEPVRFDLGDKAPKPATPAPPAKKPEKPKVDPEEEKRKRIAGLKKKAKEAAARAKARREGEAEQEAASTGDIPTGEISLDRGSAEKASERRGAPKKAIRSKITGDGN